MSHYQTLGVATNASAADIKNAYRSLVKQFHPDINTAHGSHEKMQAVNEAYEILSDFHARNLYDMMLSGYAVPEPKKETEEERYRREYKKHKAHEERLHIENLIKLKVKFYKFERTLAYFFFAMGILFTVDFYSIVKEEVHPIKQIKSSRMGAGLNTTDGLFYQVDRGLFFEYEKSPSTQVVIQHSGIFEIPVMARLSNSTSSYSIFGTLHSFQNIFTIIILVFSGIVLKHKEYSDFRLTCGLVPFLLIVFQLLMAFTHRGG